MLFYLGTHQPGWLARADVPLFVSARRLRRLARVPVAACDWALDSGGFTELRLHGGWQTSPQAYADEARRWRDAAGRLAWAAIQDWMCEPFMVERTGLTVAEHQARTIASWHDLRRVAPDVPWVPVLQGWHPDDYLAHVEAYRAAGTDLAALPVVGLGSVCRRQGMAEAEAVVRQLAGLGIRLHAFGFKTQGLRRCGDALASSDSLAWSYAARRDPPLAGCRHANCANCMRYALAWRRRVIRIVDGPRQRLLFPA